MKYGFVYIWFDKKRKMYYIGCHWGQEDDGYICSSNRMKAAYNRRPYDFKRKLLETNIVDRKIMFELEEKWLQKAEKRKEKYYNLNYKTGHWSVEKNKYKTITEKLRAANIKQFSDPEARKKHSERSKKLWADPEYRKKHEGKHKHSDETKQKIKAARAKQTFSEETRKKLSEAGKRYYQTDLGKERKTKNGLRMKGNNHAKI